MKTELPAFMKEPEKIECINCGWTGTRDYLEELDTCPECQCDGYIIEDESNYADDEESKEDKHLMGESDD